MSTKYICIHGHFYQPPRENAWLEFVELQDSAYPWHDWNERINFECYAPNSAARILNDQGKIQKIVNNYNKISFNFGPTLLSWLEISDPLSYQGILRADRESLDRFNGHGSALAQVYNHMIMPLADEQDKETQVIWGIADFESRFGRKPEGMWLAETAADVASLEHLAAHGIKYTILAPRQAKAVRHMGNGQWHQVNDATIDTKQAYQVNLPSGKTIAVFFYDGKVAQEVAFKGLLNNGKNFAGSLMAQADGRKEAQLIHMATDGESYGHHHRFGEMALADCLDQIEQRSGYELINYGYWLEKFPPKMEAQIHDNSSWSCVHGVERWRSDCGCNTGGNGGWNQSWRGPLRNLLDWLRDELRPLYNSEIEKLGFNPKDIRNKYIAVILNRDEAAIESFLKKNIDKKLSKEEKILFLRLLEMQRNAMLMYTSCAWFFDEVSGIETDQVLQYALRAIKFAQRINGRDLHEEFLNRLKSIPSNKNDNAAVSYQNNVIKAELNLSRVAMHVGMASVFSDSPTDFDLYNYSSSADIFHKYRAGTQRMVMGKTKVKSHITFQERSFYFATIYIGQQNFTGHISEILTKEEFLSFKEQAEQNFEQGNLAAVSALMQDFFKSKPYSIWQLFKDEKRKTLEEITNRNLKHAESTFHDIYNDNYQLMNSMQQSGLRVPITFLEAARFVLNRDLRQILEAPMINLYKLEDLVADLKKWKLEIQNLPEFLLAASDRIYYEIRMIVEGGGAEEDITQLSKLIDILSILDGDLNLWQSQNVYYDHWKNLSEKTVSDSWSNSFLELGAKLNMAV